MKKLILIVACLSFAGATAYCQDAKTSKTKAATSYVCPKCKMATSKPGNCEHCQVAKVKVGDYYCEGCFSTTSQKQGTCPKCKKNLVKMEAPKS